MLPLDSPRWGKLSHAYGSAAEGTSAPTGWSAAGGFHSYHSSPSIVESLRQLAVSAQPKEEPKCEPWETLYSSLCHQGTIYPASFAAVPHIIEIGLRAATNGPIDFSFFVLPTIIEQARLGGQQPQCDEDILTDYHRAISRLHDLAFAVRSHAWPLHYGAAVAAALAVSKGYGKLSECFQELADESTVNDFFEWFYNR